MPPKASGASKKPSTSKEVITTGPKQVFSKGGKRGEGATERPTTTRALILRNGKYGARGTGEIVLSTRMTGREKLDLLAEDLIEKAQKSLRAPFKIEECIEIAVAQFGACIDDVRALKNHEFFFELIESELQDRQPQSKNVPDNQSSKPEYIANIVATRIHNSYMLASAWKLVADSLCDLQMDGLSNTQVVNQLKNSSDLRSRYLVLYDMVNILVDVNQTKFAVLATTTPHYAKYFKEAQTETGSKEMVFDWNGVREACRSFLDSIVVELCFPRAPYPKAILYQILHDAVDEAPREARRFPQALWNAVGDLSVCVQLQSLLETPLLSPEAKGLKDEPREMPIEFQEWVDAQLYSEAATEKYASFQNTIFPLERTKKADVLSNMWKTINMNYRAASGKSIDSLWRLTGVVKPAPSWHSYKIPKGDLSDDEDGLPRQPSGKTGKQNQLAIEDGANSDDSMPPLQEVSDSDEDWSSDDDDEEDYDDEGLSDEESGYDTDEEDELREMLREAMDAAHDSNWKESGPDPEEYKGNPFLKLLGSLRGRMFQSSSKLKTASGKAKPPPPGALDTMFEDDEDETTTAKKKKKKKKPKKKKKKTSAKAEAEAEDEAESESEAEAPPASPSTTVSSAPVSAPAPAPPAPKAKSPAKPKPKPASSVATQSVTSFSLPLEDTTSAQSARSYIKSENLDAPKTKIKSRPDHASLFSNAKGVLSRFGVGKEGQGETPQEKKEKRNFFGSLRRRTRDYMHQILHTADDETKGSAGMKWDTFVKVMEDMGFDVNPSTAGSSVRFTPRNSKDNPISFHKPHPDSTIPPKMLKQFSKRLRDHYDWKPEDLN